MTEKRSDNPNPKKMRKYCGLFGQSLRSHFDDPPYISPKLGSSREWTPTLFSDAVGFSAWAVRQWLRGDVLPRSNMPTIIRELFGPHVEQHSDKVRQLWKLLRHCETCSDRDHDDSINAPALEEAINASKPPLLTEISVHIQNQQTAQNHLEGLIGQNGYIGIEGIFDKSRESIDIVHVPIDNLYVDVEIISETAEKITAIDAVKSYTKSRRRIVIEGPAGSGKTTLLRMICTQLARERLLSASAEEAIKPLDARDDESFFPIFVSLPDLAQLLPRSSMTSLDGGVSHIIDLQLNRRNDPGDLRAELINASLESGHATLLFDGLDEVHDPDVRAIIVNCLKNASRIWPNCAIIVTSRPFSLAGIESIGFSRVSIAPFDKIRLFIDRWNDAVSSRIAGQSEVDHQNKSTVLFNTIQRRADLKKLAVNPVMLTCLCLVHWNEGSLPEGRSRLYRAAIRWLLASRQTRREIVGFSEFLTREALAALALAMMGEGFEKKVSILEFERCAEIVNGVMVKHFSQSNSIKRAREWLRFECLWSGVIELKNGDSVRFKHLTFQEFLAASALAERSDEDSSAGWSRTVLSRLDDPTWRETIAFFPGELLDEGGRGRIDLFLERIIESFPDYSAVDNAAKLFGILEGICWTTKVYSYQPSEKVRILLDEIKITSLGIFQAVGDVEVPLESRAAAAEALGRTGDPRLREYNFLPIGDTSASLLGKFPVTVREYGDFIDDGGYSADEHWIASGREFSESSHITHPDGWDIQLDYPNRPVVGISWYEADAYCKWYSQFSQARFRVPNEAEWLLASGRTTREFPWGDALPDRKHANFFDVMRRPTPVGIFPLGDGPHGHSDLIGNAWEWTSTLQGAGYWLRGGSWADCPIDLRSQYKGVSFVPPQLYQNATRVLLSPQSRISSIGFRLACDP